MIAGATGFVLGVLAGALGIALGAISGRESYGEAEYARGWGNGYRAALGECEEAPPADRWRLTDHAAREERGNTK